MNDLLEKLEAAIDQRARAIEGSGFLGWLTFRFADGSMHYTAAAGSQPLDEPHWIVDGKKATGYTSARVIYDEKRERRRVARDRKLLELHRPLHADREYVECTSCAEDSPCRTLRLLAEDYEIKVQS